MDLHCENNEKHSIQAYDLHRIQVNNQYYEKSLILTATQLVIMPSLTHLVDVTPALVLKELQSPPSILIIGHHVANLYLAPMQQHDFIQHKIGVECMSFDAACRTYNILLSEGRTVAILLLMP